MDEVVRDFHVTIGAAYDRGDKKFLPASKTSGARFVDYETAVGRQARHITRGDTIPLDPALSVTCISSGGVVLGENPPSPGHDENDMSVSLLIQYGAFRYFVGGDIEEPTEAKIASGDLVKDVDVYQADHHGSDSSSSLAFMQSARNQGSPGPGGQPLAWRRRSISLARERKTSAKVG